jgi:hypothetical protein
MKIVYLHVSRNSLKYNLVKYTLNPIFTNYIWFTSQLLAATQDLISNK